MLKAFCFCCERVQVVHSKRREQCKAAKKTGRTNNDDDDDDDDDPKDLPKQKKKKKNEALHKKKSSDWAVALFLRAPSAVRRRHPAAAQGSCAVMADQQPQQPQQSHQSRMRKGTQRKDIKLVRTKVFSVFAVRTKGPLPRQLLYRPEDMFAALGFDTELAKLTSLEDRRERAGVRIL